MKDLKKLAAVIAVASALGIASVAFAEAPAEAAADPAGNTAQEVQEERAEAKSFRGIFKDPEKLEQYKQKLEEFKRKMLERQKAALDKRVEEGKITQEQADEIYNKLEEKLNNSDGTRRAFIGGKFGPRFGKRGFGMGMNKGTDKDADKAFGNEWKFGRRPCEGRKTGDNNESGKGTAEGTAELNFTGNFRNFRKIRNGVKPDIE